MSDGKCSFCISPLIIRFLFLGRVRLIAWIPKKNIYIYVHHHDRTECPPEFEEKKRKNWHLCIGVSWNSLTSWAWPPPSISLLAEPPPRVSRRPPPIRSDQATL